MAPLTFTDPAAAPTMARRAPAPTPLTYVSAPYTGPQYPPAAVPGSTLRPPPAGPGRPALGYPGQVPQSAPTTGRSMIIDGSGQRRPRPPLLTLARRQPSLALRLGWRELAPWAKPFHIPHPAASPAPAGPVRALWAAGAVLGVVLVLATTWFATPLGVAWLATQAAVTLPAQVPVFTALAPCVTALLALAVQTGSALRSSGLRRAVGSFNGADAGATVRTAALYGPGLLLTVVAATVAGVALAGFAALAWAVEQLTGSGR
jgi:hypothetical protein